MTEPFLAVLFACFVIGLMRWRLAVIAVMVLAVGEGALRKWVFPDAQQYVYFLKDALLLGAYVAYFGRRFRLRQKLFLPHPANGVLALFVVLAVLQVANPELPTPLVGLFGLRAYLIYVPLMYVVPAVLPDSAALRKFWIWYLLLALAPLLLGPVQFNSPRDSELNRYSWAEEPNGQAITFGEANAPARITGTFSFISGYTTYLLIIVIVGIALALFERGFWFRCALYAFLALAAVNLLMTGSRGPFLILAAAVPLLFLIAAYARGARLASVMLGATIAIPALALFLPVVASEEVGSVFMARVRSADSVTERMVDPFRGPWDALDYSGIFGYGIGSTHQASTFIVPDSGRIAPPAEGEWVRIVLELGPIGFVLTVLIRILVAVRLWKAIGSADASSRPFVASALIFGLAHFPGNLAFNHTAALFYWFVAGFAFIAPVPHGAASVAPAATRTGVAERAG